MTKKLISLALLLVAVFTLHAQEKQGMVPVPGGTFQMGSPSGGRSNERPVRSVTVSSFFMDIHPVTQKQWHEIMGTNPSYFKGDDRPVESVSWFDAAEYANRLSRREGLTPAYGISGNGDGRTVTWNRDANGYRLPTEAEWEYAARGGNGSPGNFTYSGSGNINEVAWYIENNGGGTQPVGTLKPNALGLYDMSGNVWEWCWDWWYGAYPDTAQTDPDGASSGSYRVIRGGSWNDSDGRVRSASRSSGSPPARSHYNGFRLVRSGLTAGR